MASASYHAGTVPCAPPCAVSRSSIGTCSPPPRRQVHRVIHAARRLVDAGAAMLAVGAVAAGGEAVPAISTDDPPGDGDGDPDQPGKKISPAGEAGDDARVQAWPAFQENCTSNYSAASTSGWSGDLPPISTVDGDTFTNERILLAAILTADDDNPEAPLTIPEARELLDPLRDTDFRGNLERATYRAIRDHADRGVPFDAFAVGSTIKARGIREDEYTALWQRTKRLGRAKDAHRAILLERDRRAIREAAEALGRAADGVDPVAAAQAVLERLHAATDAASRGEQGGRRALLGWPDLGAMVDNAPPEIDLLFPAPGLFPAGCVSSVFGSGGSGKTTLALQLAASLATGTRFGLFDPYRPRRVLYLAGEDPEAVLHRRVHMLARAMRIDTNPRLRQNLGVVSLVGEQRVLVELDRGGNARESDTFGWLDKSLESMDPLDLVVIDPLSRFSGVAENSNEQVTAVVAALEKLAARHKCAILVLHHEPKRAAGTKLSESTGRGASALRDGIRCALSVGPLDEKIADRLDLRASEYLAIRCTKNNYGRESDRDFHLRRGEGGILAPCDLAHMKAQETAEALAAVLAETGGATRRDISRGLGGRLREALPGVTRNELANACTYGLREGLLHETREARGPRGTPVVLIGAAS
jgi:hypothetical protein